MGCFCCLKKRTTSISIQDTFNPLTPDNKITFNDFEALKVIGRGSFGKVLLVRNKNNNEIYAMKILKKSIIKEREQEEHTKTEQKILKINDNPFIVKLYFSFQDNENLYIVTEFMQGGELFFHLHKEKKFNEERTIFYASQIILALEGLHKENIIYRDLKPENILLGVDGYIKLTDFGLSKILKSRNKRTYTICGTPQYLAPEILEDEGYSKMVDWWSLGCLIFEMLAGRKVFMIPKNNALTPELYKKKIDFPDYLSKEAVDIITKFLEYNPKNRLGYGTNGINDIKNHQFFKNINWDDIYNKKIIVDEKYIPKVKDKMDLKNFDTLFTNEKLSESLEDSDTKKSNDDSDYKDFSYINGSLIKNT